ncbi:MAG: hypothetical protein LBL15_04280, partial [Oscillospiraceae bacterium]|jgi:hypothetical protein|nr:hypothetical protein [Oscillospiraceae bacterium]
MTSKEYRELPLAERQAIIKKYSQYYHPPEYYWQSMYSGYPSLTQREDMKKAKLMRYFWVQITCMDDLQAAHACGVTQQEAREFYDSRGAERTSGTKNVTKYGGYSAARDCVAVYNLRGKLLRGPGHPVLKKLADKWREEPTGPRLPRGQKRRQDVEAAIKYMRAHLKANDFELECTNVDNPNSAESYTVYLRWEDDDGISGWSVSDEGYCWHQKISGTLMSVGSRHYIKGIHAPMYPKTGYEIFINS